jgi:hypothetical protein
MQFSQRVGRPGRTFRFGVDLAPLLAQRQQLRARDDPHNGDCTFAVDGRTITFHGHVEAVNPTNGKAGLRSKPGTGGSAPSSLTRSACGRDDRVQGDPPASFDQLRRPAMGPIHALRPDARATTVAPGLTRSKRSMTSSFRIKGVTRHGSAPDAQGKHIL